MNPALIFIHEDTKSKSEILLSTAQRGLACRGLACRIMGLRNDKCFHGLDYWFYLVLSPLCFCFSVYVAFVGFWFQGESRKGFLTEFYKGSTGLYLQHHGA